MPFTGAFPLSARHSNSVVRSGDWKLIRLCETGKSELYNLRDDISGQHDLAREQPARVASTDRMIDGWHSETGGKLPLPNRDYQPPRQPVRRSTTRPEDAFIVLQESVSI
jgi:hypothetical protein